MRYKSNKDNLKKIIAIFIILLIVLVLIVIGYIYITKTINKEEIDNKTLCSKNGNYSKHIVLIDITDNYNFIQMTNIKQEVESIITSLEKGEQLQIFFLKDKINEDIVPVIKICNPGKGNNQNFIYNNPALIKKKWDAQFYKPLQETLSKIKSDNQFDSSPLFEMIQYINVMELKNREKINTLTIFSDMIQNSENFSFFKNNIDSFFNSNAFRIVKTDLSNTNVNIFYIRREGQDRKQTKEYGNFWIEYFMKINANVNKIKKMDG